MKTQLRVIVLLLFVSLLHNNKRKGVLRKNSFTMTDTPLKEIVIKRQKELILVKQIMMVHLT
jgi:hypothetical protein